MLKKYLFGFGIVLFLFFSLSVKETRASELEVWMEETGISFDTIDNSLKDTALEDRCSFRDILSILGEGDLKKAGQMFLSLATDTMLSEISENRKNIVQIILLAVFAALFTNISASFLSSSLQETGFYAAYLSMSGLILTSFFLMKGVADRTVQEMLGFMEALIPSYAIAVTMVSGSASSIALYEMTFFLIRGCQWMFHRLLIPVIECYMLVGMMNYVGETERFSYLGALMKKGTEQIMKWTVALVLSLNLIQSMILPAIDAAKHGIWQRGLTSIPGAGPIISAVTGSVLGSSVLIKNSIGAGAVLFLVFLCVIPVAKLILLTCSFYLCTAFLQPVSDKRLTGLLHTAGDGGKLFLEMVVTCFAMFFITIALITVSTNMRYYAL